MHVNCGVKKGHARPAGLIIAVVWGLSPSPAGTSATSSRVDPAPPAAFGPIRLFPLPPRVARRCQLARRIPLCPRRLPRAWLAGWRAPRGTSPPPLTANSYGPFQDGNARLVELSFVYSAPWEPDSGSGWRNHVWRNRPCCFLHFELYRALSGRPPMPRTVMRATLGGHRGLLAPAAGYGLGCGSGNESFFCNHWRFFWRQWGSWYVATLHHFGPETPKLLSRLIAELRPAH